MANSKQIIRLTLFLIDETRITNTRVKVNMTSNSAKSPSLQIRQILNHHLTHLVNTISHQAPLPLNLTFTENIRKLILNRPPMFHLLRYWSFLLLLF